MRFGAVMVGVLALVALAAGLAMGPARSADDMKTGDMKAGDMKMGDGKYAVATFAGGCFWCMQPPFDEIKGVIRTTAGYTGGAKTNPTYEEVSAGGTGHAESVEIVYDPSVVTYRRLLEIFWHNVDPVAKDRQFCDVGHQYRSAIFFHGDEQRKEAEESKAAIEASGRFQAPVATEIVAAGPFYPAEEYHQAYYRKNPGRYAFYRWGCGRDDRLRTLWGADAGHAEE